MSLQVWLPLNGNINNQGICDDIEISAGTPQYIDGKMGQGIDISHRVTFSGLPRLNNFSIFFWLKVDSCTVSWADSLGFDCKQADGANAATFRFEATTSTRACSWHNNSPYGISSGTQILIQNYGEWHHVGLTYDGDNVFSYIDGKLKYTDSGLGGYLIDRFWIGETGNIVGVMNDLRIYDNVLSKSEVKELSNGCLLHYSFNNGYGNENLIIEANKASSWVSDGCAKSNIQDKEFGECIKVVGASANCRIYRPVQNVWTPVGAKFTVSFWAKSDEDGTIINASRSIVDFTSNFTLTTKWQRYVGHITITATATEGTLSIRIVTAGRTVYIKDVKLERGEHNSPWSPNPLDELYSQLGFDDTTIRNNAGYKMDGIMSKQLTYSSDSIIGTSSLDLRGEDYISYIRVPDYPKLEKDFTWNVWVKQNNSTLPKITQTVISQGRDWVNNNAENGTDCGFNIFIVNGKPEIRYGHWVASGSSNRQLLSNVTLDNEWHMITASVDKDGISRIYVDGTLKNTSTVATICKYTQATGNLIIGKTSYHYADTNQFFAFNGLIDDVRLYATALPDQDIKTLYQSKVRIDKNGNMFASQFKEDNITTSIITKKGESISKTLSEQVDIYDMKTKMLDDGSEWARIFYHNNHGKTVLFSTLDEAKNIHAEDKYSRIILLDDFVGKDGKYEFMLCYPTKAPTQYNRWKQTNNPCNEYVSVGDIHTVDGYEPIHIDWTTHYFGGMARQSYGETTFNNCYLSGTIGHNYWFYAIGANSIHGDGIPDWNGSTADDVELWVRIDNLSNKNVKARIGKKYINVNEIIEN